MSDAKRMLEEQWARQDKKNRWRKLYKKRRELQNATGPRRGYLIREIRCLEEEQQAILASEKEEKRLKRSEPKVGT